MKKNNTQEKDTKIDSILSTKIATITVSNSSLNPDTVCCIFFY